MCNHCGATISRGKPDAPRDKCYNRGMQAHMELKHPDGFEKVVEKRVEMKEKKRDKKDETVRGTVPLYNLRNREENMARLFIYL